MSKVVKGIGRAVGKVVNGIGTVVTKVTGSKTLGKVAKVVAVAAGVYFTGGAALGAISGAAAGTGALAGAASGLSSAWAGLAGAGSALAAGQFGAAASSLGAGWAGAANVGAMGVGAGLSGAAAGTAAQGAALAGGQGFGAALSTTASHLGGITGVGQSVARQGATSLATDAVKSATTPASTGGNLLQMAASSAPMWQAASGAIQAGGQAYSANKAEEYDREKTEEERRRYNANTGAQLNIFERFRQAGGI